MENFGERIREMRKERGITSYEMADKLGISRNTLTNWERCEREPHAVEILEKMARILKVPLKNLLAGENEYEVENNPIIKDLQNRVSRLEQVIRKFIK